MKYRSGFLFFIFLITIDGLFSIPAAFGNSLLTVTFLDVGEGDAIYIETPRGDKILIDAGNPMTGFHVANYLKSSNVDTLTAVFITHPHPDHMGGIFHLIPRLDIKSIYDNGQIIARFPTEDIYRWYRETIKGLNYKPVAAGDVFQYGKVKILVLWPKSPTSSNWNENSLVLKIVYGKTAFLLMGDANVAVEKMLLNEAIDLRAQVLKIGHHGALDSSSTEFLKAVAPSNAVISVNKNNIRENPSSEVLNRMKNMGIKALLTYQSGNIVFTVNRNDVVSLSLEKN